VTQVQSYGPEARGGACKAEVVISDDPIHYPLVRRADTLLAMSQEALDRYIGNISPRGVLIVDSDLVKKVQFDSIVRIPATEMASQKLKRRIVANIIMLGALVRATKIVSRQALEKAIYENVPKGTEELNKKALELGYNYI
jgi:2-oxoglutarate ferredoxin oxidoreductase subunit gamma